jgi:ribonuclease P protein component
MLPKANRLRRAYEFRQVRNRGRSWASPLLILYVYRRRDDLIRAGFVVGKRIGKAAVRNRVKRLMREALRASLEQVKPGYDLLLIARPTAAEANYHDIRQTIEALLQRSGLLQCSVHHA